MENRQTAQHGQNKAPRAPQTNFNVDYMLVLENFTTVKSRFLKDVGERHQSTKVKYVLLYEQERALQVATAAAISIAAAVRNEMGHAPLTPATKQQLVATTSQRLMSRAEIAFDLKMPGLFLAMPEINKYK